MSCCTSYTLEKLDNENMMVCDCGQTLMPQEILEQEEAGFFATWFCASCALRIGAEGEHAELSSLLPRRIWTDEALHHLDRLPPYIEILVRQEVEGYAEGKSTNLITRAFMIQAQNQGTVEWDPDAEVRMEKVPSPVRAMARIELERTALDRGLPSVTVELMEELKARYFGMATQSVS
jgi:hypothetical protein